MLNGLLDIYEDWKTKLDKLGQPYYLKIWLFEPRFSLSQVVCAIGENVNFYKNTFDEPGVVNAIQLEHYGTLNAKLSKVRWNCCLDEDHYFNNEVSEQEDYASKEEYEDMVRWFEKLLKKPHRTHKLTEPIGEMTESYSFKRGYVWLGGE